MQGVVMRNACYAALVCILVLVIRDSTAAPGSRIPRFALNKLLSEDFRSAPDLLPSYGFAALSEKIYGLPDPQTGERVALWSPETHRMHPEELGTYERGDILIPRPLPSYIDFKNGLVDPSSRWSKGYIPYYIDGTFTDEELITIYSAMEIFNQLACIHFIPWAGEEDYLSIENTDTGCWSSVGRIGGKQTLNLQTPACVWGVGTPLHELMHTIGFYHEQSRHERDKFVQVFWNNILEGEQHNFKKFPKSYVLSKIPYDYYSVMHYSQHAFSKNNRATIKAKVAGVTLGQREFLSDSDVRKIRLMYKCNGFVSHVD